MEYNHWSLNTMQMIYEDLLHKFSWKQQQEMLALCKKIINRLESVRQVEKIVHEDRPGKYSFKDWVN